MILMFSVIWLLIFLYVSWRSLAAFSHGYSWGEMDWNQDGMTSFPEFFEASDVGKRSVKINSEDCIEFFSFKDGLPIKTICGKN